MSDLATRLEALERLLRDMDEVAVAVSGGVDSLTLGAVAHRVLGDRCAMYHAVSPAVPAEATRRTRELARIRGWSLHVLGAGEFDDEHYLSNPVNRCFYCKTNLYGAISPLTSAQIVSGTNLDDLGEYRPGLEAAANRGVRHPFVEAALRKRGVRELARLEELGEIAELPASPCLSSRVETGIRIEGAVLDLVHRSELLVERELRPRTVRCRVRAGGVVIELDEDTLGRLDESARESLCARIHEVFLAGGRGHPVTVEAYRTGSAFLRKPA